MFGKNLLAVNGGKKPYKQYTCDRKKGGRGRLIVVAVE